MVKARIRPAWGVWVRDVGKGIPTYRLWITVCAFGPRIAVRDIVAIADATVARTGWRGIVLTMFALHVKDARQHKEFRWGSDISIEVQSVTRFKLVLSVNSSTFEFSMPYSAKFRIFLDQLSNLCRSISVPESVIDAVESAYSFELDVSPKLREL